MNWSQFNLLCCCLFFFIKKVHGSWTLNTWFQCTSNNCSKHKEFHWVVCVCVYSVPFFTFYFPSAWIALLFATIYSGQLSLFPFYYFSLWTILLCKQRSVDCVQQKSKAIHFKMVLFRIAILHEENWFLWEIISSTKP